MSLRSFRQNYVGDVAEIKNTSYDGFTTVDYHLENPI